MTIETRPTVAADAPALRAVIDDAALFPGEMLADMIAPFLAGGAEAAWLTLLAGGAPAGLCFAEPEPMADAVWNMRAIAVAPTRRRQGGGAALVSDLEEALAAAGARLLLADTSGTAAFAGTRTFYERLGYARTAVIADYWEDGDDKVTFLKRLRPPA